MIRQAMILAAGYGSRMEEMTKNIPKPMIKIGGVSLIERLILNLAKIGINKILVNSHYLADKLESHINYFLNRYNLKGKIKLIISYEPELLETGGAIKKNLEFFENKPFFALNSDIIYSNLKKNLRILSKKISKFPEAELILSVANNKNIRGLYSKKGDFTLKNNKLYLMPENNMIYTGLQLINNLNLNKITEKKFSLSIIYRELSNDNILYGTKFIGNLFHVGDIKAYKEAQKYYESTENIPFLA